MSYKNNEIRYTERTSFSGVQGILMVLPAIYYVDTIYDFNEHLEDYFESVVNELIRIRKLVHNHESRLKVNSHLYPVILDRYTCIGNNGVLYEKFRFDNVSHCMEKCREVRKILEGLFVTGEITINSQYKFYGKR